MIKEYNVCDRKHLNTYESLAILKNQKQLNLEVVNKAIPFYIKKLSFYHYYHTTKEINKLKKYFCNNCNINILKRGIWRHNKSITHQKNINIIIPETIYLDEDEDFFELSKTS